MTSPDQLEAEYRRRIAAMAPRERIARSMASLAWARAAIARQIMAGEGPVAEDRLRWLVALRLYGSDPRTVALIHRAMGDA